MSTAHIRFAVMLTTLARFFGGVLPKKSCNIPMTLELRYYVKVLKNRQYMTLGNKLWKIWE